MLFVDIGLMVVLIIVGVMLPYIREGMNPDAKQKDSGPDIGVLIIGIAATVLGAMLAYALLDTKIVGPEPPLYQILIIIGFSLLPSVFFWVVFVSSIIKRKPDPNPPKSSLTDFIKNNDDPENQD
jgi:hypothetical protein